MPLLNFSENSILVNLAIFALMAGVIWFAGTRISFYADDIADRTGLGKAFVGLLFLALATETPEMGTTISASISGNADLVVNSIFGGVILQTAMLAITDFVVVRGALTFFTPKPVLLLQGVLLIALLAFALGAIGAGELVTFGGVGLWSVLLLVAYLATLYIAQRYEGKEEWEAENAPSEEERVGAIQIPEATTPQKRFHDWSTGRLILFFAIGAAFIFGAGVVLARVGEALATQTGLGQSFIGATLIATSTSLPELSVAITLTRLGNYGMAISSVLGSNSIMMLLLFVADLFYREGPILNNAGPTALFTAAIGIVVTAVYLAGLIERRDKAILRMGFDSALVIAIYLGSLVVLYQLRGT